jgi:hypothetical protein
MRRRSSKRIAKRLSAGLQSRIEPRPLLRNIPHRQIDQFESSLIRWKNLLRFNHFPQTAIHRLNRIGGVNCSANLGQKSKEWDNMRPMTAPRLGDRRILLVPFLSKQLKVKLSLRFSGRTINSLEVSTNLLALLPRHKSD